MGKNKRKQPTSERGIVLAWQRSDTGNSKGFGFIERADGTSKIFAHKSQIADGNALQVGTAVIFDARADPKPDKPDNMIACNVRGGVCFDNVFRKCCLQGRGCRFSHAQRLIVRAPPPPPLSLEAAAAAVASARGGSPPPVLVDTLEACQEHMARLAASGGAVAVDFEGANLCRDGELYLAQLAAASGPVVLVDVVRLGDRAFGEGGLRALLESESVTKLIFDGRADADALYHLHGTKLANVCDLQVICARQLDAAAAEEEEAGAAVAGAGAPTTTSGASKWGTDAAGVQKRLSADKLPGLAMAMRHCPSLQGPHGAALAALKRSAADLFVPERGGSYDVWKQRPMPSPIVEYAAADVAHLHAMRAAWGARVGDDEMREITTRRIERAINAADVPKGPHMAQRDF